MRPGPTPATKSAATEVLETSEYTMKVFDGGYIPILIAATMVLVMWTWLRGSAHVLAQARRGAVTIQQLAAMLAKSSRLVNVPGTAVFLTSDPEMAPAALTHNIKHNQVLHAQNLIVGVNMVTRPYVEDADRLEITPISDRFTRVDLNFGYMEEPNVPKALALARKKGIKFDIMTTSFFLNRRSFKSASKGGLPLWQENIFRMLSRSAADATHFYRLPTNRVIELGQQLTI